jgi:FHA domain
MDKPGRSRETADMLAAGSSRQRLARTLNAAYGDGLLSEGTFAHRLDLLLRAPVVDPASVVGDLTFRRRHRTIDLIRRALAPAPPPAPVMALDWSGVQTELLVGRHAGCDVVLEDLSVSRRHALLRFRDGGWVLRDLESTNGTTVNGSAVVRCRLLPGDRLAFGDASFVVD